MNLKVSVLITSYNHAPTLRRAIESVLMQRTAFDVQVIAVDDCSSDDSVAIIRQYQDKVTCVAFPDHYGMMRAYAVGLGRCEGQYIAVCDCDDYWTDPLKLAKQVDYMDVHPDVGLCVTDVMIQCGSTLTCSPQGGKITFDTLLKGTACIYAPSYMIRREALERWVDFEKFVRIGFKVWDYPLVLELIRHCKFHRLPFYGGVFVVNPESVTHTRSRGRRLRYVLGNHRIRAWYIFKYGCKVTTIMYLMYRFTRDCYSIIFRRWTN